VLHLEPAMLQKFDIATTCDPALRVNKAHFFVCLEVDAAAGKWTPVYSVPGKDRVEIPSEAKAGHDKWCAGASYYHLGQLWTVPHKAIAKAAVAGGDRSTNTQRNTVNPDALPNVDQFDS
jgi:hypothetical protein